MKIQVKILSNEGEVLAEHEADACQPSVWKAVPGRKVQGKMPQLSDQANTGTYELFGITFQPHVRVSRPNGWVQPPPQPPCPVNGRPSAQNSFPNFPNSAPSFPGMGVSGSARLNKSTTGYAPGLRG